MLSLLMGHSGIQWLGLRASKAGGADSIPGQWTKILRALWHSQK